MIWGGSDSCQGDSGGPLYTMEDGRAVLVGLVGCSNWFFLIFALPGEQGWRLCTRRLNSNICQGETLHTLDQSNSQKEREVWTMENESILKSVEKPGFSYNRLRGPPPSKSDKTHYWTFIAKLCGRHRLFCVRAPLRAQESFVTFWGGVPKVYSRKDPVFLTKISFRFILVQWHDRS